MIKLPSLNRGAKIIEPSGGVVSGFFQRWLEQLINKVNTTISTSNTEDIVIFQNGEEVYRLTVNGHVAYNGATIPSDVSDTFKHIFYSNNTCDILNGDDDTVLYRSNGLYVRNSPQEFALTNDNNGSVQTRSLGFNTERYSINSLPSAGQTAVLTENYRFNSSGQFSQGTDVLPSSDNIKHILYSGDTSVYSNYQTSNTGAGTEQGFLVGYNSAAGEGATFYNYENSDMVFATNKDTKMRITNGGLIKFGSQNIAIGTPVMALHNKTPASYFQCTTDATGQGSSEGALFGYDNTNGVTMWSYENTPLRLGQNNTERLRINTSGYIQAPGIYNNTTANASNVYVDSSGLLYRNASSLKYKKNLRDLEIDTTKIYDIESKTFTMKNSGLTGHGPIAEDICNVHSDFATYDAKGDPEAIHEHNVLFALLEEVKKLNKRIELLEQQKL